MKILRPAPAAMALLLMTAIVQAQESTDEAAEAAQKVCINSNMVRSFDAFDDRHVYVRQGSNQHFLLTMNYRCLGLEWAQSIAFKDTTSRICSDGFGEIVYRDRTMGRGLQTCRIDTIQRVESREAAEELVEGISDDNRGKDEAAREREEN